MERLSPSYRLAQMDARAEGFAEGRAQGRAEAEAAIFNLMNGVLFDFIEQTLQKRFGDHGLALMPRIRLMQDPKAMLTLLDSIKHATDLNAVLPLLPPQD